MSLDSSQTSQELITEQLANAARLEKIRNLVCNGVDPAWRLDIRYLDGSETPLELLLNRWVTYGQWRFKQYDSRPGKAAALVIADGQFAFGPHQHTCHETYLVREGRLKDSGPDGKNARLLIPGQSFSVAAGSFHAPEVLSDGCELIIEWRWPGDSLQPPGFDE